MTTLLETGNRLHIRFLARSENESLARLVVAALITSLDPTMEEMDEIKTAVSEAVTNSIIHGYDQQPEGEITMEAWLEARTVHIRITDQGRGIGDLQQVREPFYTSQPEWERSGMGFTIMEHMMDMVQVHSICGKGTTVEMKRQLSIGAGSGWH